MIDTERAAPCFVCGGTRFEHRDGVADLCLDCKLLINRSTRPLDYADGGGQAVPDEQKMFWRLRNAAMRLDLLKPYLAGHRVLVDIGCGSGEMLEAATEMFEHRFGFDTNGPLIRYIRDRSNATVFQSHFDPALLPQSVIGLGKVFTLSHVLEHLESPLSLIASIRDAMESGDILYVEVPLHTGQSFREQGFDWTLWNHEHLALYSPEALRRIADHSRMTMLHHGTRIFARGSYSGKTRLKLFFRSPLEFFKAIWRKGRHSIADLMIADYGCLILRKP